MRQRNLFPKPADATTGILMNDRCLIRTEQEHRIVIVSGIPLAQYAVRDRMAESYAMVKLARRTGLRGSSAAPPRHFLDTWVFIVPVRARARYDSGVQTFSWQESI